MKEIKKFCKGKCKHQDAPANMFCLSCPVHKNFGRSNVETVDKYQKLEELCKPVMEYMMKHFSLHQTVHINWYDILITTDDYFKSTNFND